MSFIVELSITLRVTYGLYFIVPYIGDIYRGSEKFYECDACLTTTVYDDTYLDPAEECKAIKDKEWK